MKFSHVDGGKEFDWGKTSQLYAKYRDIYPPEFLNRLCAAADIAAGNNILDIGTGTGVIPRMLYGTGAYFTGIDIADNQIAEACRLAREGNMDINFICAPAENYSAEGHKLDSVIACQCFTYFDHAKLSVNLASILAPQGIFCVAYMGWLPEEDGIAARSEELILKYNPAWTGRGDTVKPLDIPDCCLNYFKVVRKDVFRLNVQFSRKSWHGRILSCRGVSASLKQDKIEEFSLEHMQMLRKSAPENFYVRHYAAITELIKL